MINKNAKKIINLLKKKKLTISFAESCTGGMLSNAITSINGSSKVFSMGLVTYSNIAKNSVLGVPKQLIKKYGAVSIQCCLSMVNNLSKISKTKICVSITSIAGPSGGSRIKPVGLVYIGINVRRKITISKYHFKKKKRFAVQRAAVKKTLELLLKTI